ncbi:MAG TPA: ATP-binding protein [Ktedonobacteraceae bacterium]
MQIKTWVIDLLKRLWHLSVRTQLAAWYATIFTILMVLFGMVSYLHLQSTLLSNMDTTLLLRTQQVSSSIVLQNENITINNSSGTLAGLADVDSRQNNSPADSDDINPALDVDLDALIRILDSHGKVKYSTTAFNTLIVPPQSIQKALHGSGSTVTVATTGGEEIRLHVQPLIENHTAVGVLLVGASLASVEDTLHRVIIEFLLIAPFVLAFGALGSYWLATRAFRPIIRLTSIARKIQSGNLHSRVPVPYTNDEVQHLALTFNEMLDHLEMTFKQQRRFTADASHELRTPVAAIRSMTDVALDQQLTVKEYISVLRDVNTQADHLGKLIADLLTLARADEGHIRLEREQLRLDLLANDVVATLESLATEKGITLKVEANEPLLIIGDEARMIQVIMNLLDNALKYTSRGGTVTVRVQSAQVREVCLTVQDTGIGIAQEHTTHIFERFYRVDSARTRSAGGTGLGLAIVKWIVTMHQGTIAVTSQVGKGTTFSIVLPAYQAATTVTSLRSHKQGVTLNTETPPPSTNITEKEQYK